MSRSSILKPGTLLVLRGVTYRVLIQHEPDSVNIRNLQTHQDSVLQCSDVWNGWEDGDVQFFLPGEKLDEECEYNLHASSPVGPFPEDDTRPHAERAQSQLPIAHLRWDYPLTHPNQRVELQFVTLDLLILDDEHHLPLGQPTLAAIYDRYSGYPSGITVNVEPPSDLVAMECMYFAFRKKDEVSERLSTKHDYLAYGLPEVLVVDTALGKSSSLQQACHQLGIELLFQSTNDAWLVDVIGQWLRTMDLVHVRVTPGASLSHRRHHSDPDSEDIPRMTFNRFWEALHSWIVDGYTQRAHQGVGGSPESEGVPVQLWQHALESNFFPRMPLKSGEVLALLPRTAERRIGYSGIVYECITYHSAALAALRAALIGSNRGVSSRSSSTRETFHASGFSILSPGSISKSKQGISIMLRASSCRSFWRLNDTCESMGVVLPGKAESSRNLSLCAMMPFQRIRYLRSGQHLFTYEIDIRD